MEASQSRFATRLNFAGKTTIIIALTLIVTGLINWVLGGWTFYNTMREEAVAANRQTAETLARRLEDLILSSVNFINFLAHDSRVNWQDPDSVQLGITRFRSQGGPFQSLSFVANDGRLKAADPPRPADLGADMSGEDFVREVLRGRRAYISEAFGSQGGGMDVIVAVPVIDARGARAGVLFGSTSLLNDNATSRLLAGTSPVRGGLVVIVDRRGRTLYHPDAALVTRNLSGNAIVDLALQGRDGVAEGVDPSGQEVLAAFSPVRNAGWAVIAEVPVARIREPFWRFNKQTLAVSLLTLVAATLFGLVMTKRLLRPLNQLLSAVRAVSSGDLRVQVPAETRDEWGMLAAAFNRMVNEISSHQRRLETRASTDCLTKVFNRGFFEERLGLELAWARRTGSPLSILLADIDDFKSYNDTFGHPAGDEVLATAAALLREAVRDCDLVARYGGEEFVVILPNTDCDMALTVAERVRRAVENYPFANRAVTVSIGVACFPLHGSDAVSLVVRADEALYRAKGAGKNRVVLAETN